MNNYNFRLLFKNFDTKTEICQQKHGFPDYRQGPS